MKDFSLRQCTPAVLLAACLSGLVAAGGLVTAAEPLAWRFDAGDEHNFQLLQEMEMTIQLGPGGTTSTGVNQTIDMTWAVESVDEQGVAVVEQRINRVQMEIRAPGKTHVSYDTASDEPPQGYAAMLAPALAAMSSSPLQLTVSPRGEITEVEVPEPLVEAVSQGRGAALLGILASPEGFQKTVRQYAIVLPEEEDLVEGYEWTTQVEWEIPATGTITTETTFRYQGSREVDGQRLEVFAPTLKTIFGEGPEGTSIEVRAEESEGKIVFNRSAGRLESSELDQQLDLLTTVGGNSVEQRMQQKVRWQFVPPTSDP